jgi:hypothetical protein
MPARHRIGKLQGITCKALHIEARISRAATPGFLGVPGDM